MDKKDYPEKVKIYAYKMRDGEETICVTTTNLKNVEGVEYRKIGEVEDKDVFIRDVECLIDIYITDIENNNMPLAMRWLAEKLYDSCLIIRKEK